MERKIKADRILIVRTDRIGDVLLSTPVIKALRENYPHSHIAMMVRPYARDIVEGNPFLDEVLIYDKEGCHKSFFSSLQFALALRRKKFDLAVILHPTNRVHLITWLAAIPVRLGFNRKLGFLLTLSIPDEKHLALMHEADYGLELLKEIGIVAKDKTLFMPIKKDSVEWVSNFFTEKAIDRNKPLIYIHPGASCISKKWPISNFARLIKGLIEEFRAEIVIFVGGEDKEIARQIYGLCQSKPLCVLEDIPLPRIAALLKKGRLLISNDSGPVHISVAVGTPVIAIFGRNQAGLSPKRWGPLGEKDEVLHKDVGCAVCMAHNCQRSFECLKAVKVENVLDAVRKIICD